MIDGTVSFAGSELFGYREAVQSILSWGKGIRFPEKWRDCADEVGIDNSDP